MYCVCVCVCVCPPPPPPQVLIRGTSRRSLFVFTHDTRLRRACVFLATNKLFEWWVEAAGVLGGLGRAQCGWAGGVADWRAGVLGVMTGFD